MANLNTGGLWVNDNKHANAPYYVGAINIGGVEYKIAAWLPDTKHPKAPALAIKVQAVGFQRVEPNPHGLPPIPDKDKDDDIPF